MFIPAKIGLFYLVFYSCLAGFFAIALAIFFTTVDSDRPSQTGMTSLLKNNPGKIFVFNRKHMYFSLSKIHSFKSTFCRAGV